MMPVEYEGDWGRPVEPLSDDPPDDADYVYPGLCLVCLQTLGIVGGMAGTGMCGPCCSGEAATQAERGETW